MTGVITISIVSHGHGALLPGLLADLAACPEVGQVIVTRNIPEDELEPPRPDWLCVLDNPEPKGFGANHNRALHSSHSPFFLVLNPDVRLRGNPFPALLQAMENECVGLCAPSIVNLAGELEDSARFFPSALDLLLKVFGRYDGRFEYITGGPALPVPWLAGMFMLFKREAYQCLNGFDEKFFLYYEDVDLCARVWNAGLQVVLCPSVTAVHDARRASRRDWRHMRWHLTSMARYFWKHWGRLPRVTQEQ
jgi:N-acetylglucosaminyl-diphospho-decaprenol L-rhamnosyltransferase